MASAKEPREYVVVCTRGSSEERACRLVCTNPVLADDWADALERSNPSSIYAVLPVAPQWQNGRASHA